MNNQNFSKIFKDGLSQILVDQFESFSAKEFGIERSKLNEIKPLINTPPVVVITGLRRVGKSTLLRQLAHKYLENNYYFVNFEDERLIDFQTKDFDKLHENLITVFGEKKIFLLDEVQNIPNWERFVRRLHDQGYKFFITGSNASLLSEEFGTRLTGRSERVELFPFSFKEYLKFRGEKINKTEILTTRKRGKYRNLLNIYLESGGIPDSLKYPELEIHKNLYNDVLYRDIAARYKIENTRSLKELTFYLETNFASLLSYNKLKDLLKLGSVNTVKNYIDHLENSWLFFVINKYAYSIKEQQIAAKKIYSIDTGLSKSIGFSFSDNKGRFLENLVFLHLRRSYDEIYYYKTQNEHEIDFYIPKIGLFIQVATNLDLKETKDREERALIEAKLENNNAKGFIIITESEEEEYIKDGVSIKVIPMYKWLINDTLI